MDSMLLFRGPGGAERQPGGTRGYRKVSSIIIYENRQKIIARCPGGPLMRPVELFTRSSLFDTYVTCVTWQKKPCSDCF